MKKTLFVLTVAAFAMSCASGGSGEDPQITAPAPAVVPDSDIGLAPGTAFEQPAQAPIGFNMVDPGESELRVPPNEDFPPVIPHSVADLETITLSENACLDCHDPVAAPGTDAPAAPASHFVDLRRSPNARGHEVVGSRWVCTSCHVAQTDATQLVGNSSPG